MSLHKYNKEIRFFSTLTNVLYVDKFGRECALIKAVYNNNYMLVWGLVNNGADIDCQNLVGESPLIIAAREDNDTIVDLLVNNGANLEIEDDAGNTALHLSGNRCREIIEAAVTFRG